MIFINMNDVDGFFILNTFYFKYFNIY